MLNFSYCKIKKIIVYVLLTTFMISSFFVWQVPEAKSIVIIPNILEGTVTDLETGEVLEGAYVRLWNKDNIVDECPPDLAPTYYCEDGQPSFYYL